MTEQKLIEVLGGIYMPSDLHDRVLARCREAAVSAGREARRSLPVRAALAAAVIALLLAGSALAATYGLWSPKLAELFGADAATQDALLESGATKIVGVSGTDNGVTVTAEQMIGDEFGVYILLKITSDDPALTDRYACPSFDITIDGEKGYYRGGRGSPENGVFRESGDDSAYYFSWHLHARDGKPLYGHEITMVISKIDNWMTYIEDIGFPIIWEGNIELTWSLDYSANTMTEYEADYAFGYDYVDVALAKVGVTPISLALYYTGVPCCKIGGYSMLTRCEYLDEDLRPIGFTMNDGIYYDISPESSGMSGHGVCVVTGEDGVRYWRVVIDLAGQTIGEGDVSSVTYRIGGEDFQVPVGAPIP